MDTEILGIVTINKHLKNCPAPIFFILLNFFGPGGDENLAILIGKIIKFFLLLACVWRFV